MRRPSVYIGGFVLAILALSAAGYAAYWYSAAGKVRDEIARWAAERRAAGWRVEMAQPDIGGFPLRIDVTVASASFAGEGDPPKWAWTLPAFHATAAPWAPGRIALSAPGSHILVAGERKYVVEAQQADGDLLADARRVHMGEMRLTGVSALAPNGEKLVAENVTLRIEQRSAQETPDGPSPAGLGIDLRAAEIRLPEPWHAPLGDAVGSVALDAVVTGAFEPSGSLREALARWRDSGGALEIGGFAISWQALKLRANGTFALDSGLQPQGATTAEIEGIDRAADALIAAGVIDARTAFAAKVANKALTIDGGPAKLPLTIQSQRLFLGPVPLLKLKTIEWN